MLLYIEYIDCIHIYVYVYDLDLYTQSKTLIQCLFSIASYIYTGLFCIIFKGDVIYDYATSDTSQL